MEGPRAPALQEYPEVVSFLDNSLRPGATWSIVSEYPTALTQQNLNNIRIIKDGKDVLSHAVIRPAIIKTPVAIYKAAAIGSVVTNSHFRNQGLSRQIIEDCITESARQDCDFAVLWTNLYDFYRKFGFELAGSELSIFVEKDLNVAPAALIFREGTNVDPAAIHKIYSRHTVNTVRSLDEIRQYLKIPNSRVYTAWDAQGGIQAYAVEGKGADLDAYIHEWGGGVNEICHLINYIRARQNRNLTLIAPSHSVSLIQKLRNENCQIHEGYLGMIKLLNTTSLFAKIVRHVRNDYGLQNFVLEKTEDAFHVGTTNQLFKTTSEHDMVKLLFGPSRPTEIFNFDPKTADVLNQVFPLRLWFWGWDSI
jgi:predicted GNAT family N-acyltransferase